MWVVEEVGCTEKLANPCSTGQTFKENLRSLKTHASQQKKAITNPRKIKGCRREKPHQEQYYIATNHNNRFYVAGIIQYDARGEIAVDVTEIFCPTLKSIDAKINKARISYRFLLRNMEISRKRATQS